MSESKFEFRRPERTERTETSEGLVEHSEISLDAVEHIFSSLLGVNSDIENCFDTEGRDFRWSDEFGALSEQRDQLELQLVEYLDAFIESGNFENVVEIARDALDHIGVKGTQSITAKTPAAATLITEAVNRAAKVCNRGFYSLKPDLIVAAWKLGARFGVGKDSNGETVYYLSDPVIGTASFHDPDGDVAAIIENRLHEEIPMWPDKWSQVSRDGESFDTLEAYATDDEEFLENLAESTLSEDDFEMRKQHLLNHRKDMVITLGEYLGSALEKLKIKS